MRPDPTAPSICSKISIAGLVIAVHIVCFKSFNHSGLRQPLLGASIPEESFAVAQIITQPHSPLGHNSRSTREARVGAHQLGPPEPRAVR